MSEYDEEALRTDANESWQQWSLTLRGWGETIDALDLNRQAFSIAPGSAELFTAFTGALTAAPALDAASRLTGTTGPSVGYSFGYPIGVIVGIALVSVVVGRAWPGRRDTPALAGTSLTSTTVRVHRDVNLRDVEGRSALLLGKAKDNNASCAIGPFIRLFDDGFTLGDLEQVRVSLRVEGEDGFVMTGESPMEAISRSPSDLVGQLLNRSHQYPDGAVLFLGTMFAPVKDRRGAGQGFTHEVGDRVEIASPRLGRLVNWVDRTDRCPPWDFGVGAGFYLDATQAPWKPHWRMESWLVAELLPLLQD